MKKFYKENRVFVILMAIVLVCLIVIGALLIKYFYGGGANKYGNRLKGIEAVKIEDAKLIEIENKIKDDTKVTSSDISISGKIVYISISVKEGVDLLEAEGKATGSLDLFSEAEKEFYDYNFYIKEDKENGFVISGAKNNGSSTIVWNNNVEIEENQSEDL